MGLCLRNVGRPIWAAVHRLYRGQPGRLALRIYSSHVPQREAASAGDGPRPGPEADSLSGSSLQRLAEEKRMAEVGEIVEERQKTHGPYRVHASCAQVLLDDMMSFKGWDQLTHEMKETLHMIAHKIGRILAGDPRVMDHWDDIAGYAKLVSRSLETQEKIGFIQ